MPAPSVLANLDVTALLWSGAVALAIGLMKISRLRRQQLKTDDALTGWWGAVLDALLGSVVGGVVLALYIPERFPAWRTPGGQAVLSIGGAIIAPYLLVWVPQAFVQLVAFFSERKIGVRITLREDKEEDKNGTDRQD